MIFPVTHDFILEPSPKAQALKVLEEASEFLEAAKADPQGEHTLEEAMDVLQALGNYCEMAFSPRQLHDGYQGVFIKNFERGYYDGHMGAAMYEKAKKAYETITG